jgi:hypothetical protein
MGKIQQMKEMLAEQAKIDYNAQPAAFRIGTFVKKQQFEFIAIDRKSGKRVKAMRARCVAFSTQNYDAAMLASKYHVE